MRIGMMVDTYKPHISGITNYIALNKQYLEALGHQVYVFTFGDVDYVDDEKNIIRSPGLPLLDTGYYISMRYTNHARELLSTMDLIHLHHPFLSGSLALRYCRPRGIPIIFTNHTRYDIYAQAYLPGVPDIVNETALKLYLPAFCRSCDLVISPSAGMKEILIQFGVDAPIEIVPNGVDLHPFWNVENVRQRSAFGFCEDDVVLVYTGRLALEKSLTFLLRSFAGLVQSYPNSALLLIGDGPERDNLEDQVRIMNLSDRVHFTGMVAYKDLPGYLASTDAFVTASISEVHPLSVIEAMAAGLPILGISSPGVGDTVQDGETGLLASKQDLAVFTAKMVRMVNDHEMRRVMGAAARLASKEYAIENTTGQMLERYQRIAVQASGRKRGFRARLTRMLDHWRG